MSPALIIAVLLVLFFAAVPIVIALGAVSMIYMHSTDIPLQAVAQRMFAGLDSFPLAAIPFFILSGALMEASGISRRLIDFAQSLVGRLPGGLGMVTVLSAMFFAAISGSSAATTAAIGSILIPAMASRGYSRRFATATQAASGELGVIVPPSIPLIIYALTAGVPVSIGDLFMAGVLPGILIACSLLVTVYAISRRRGYGLGTAGDDADRIPRKWPAFRAAILPLLMPFIVLGGIYGGVFTPTEAAVVAVAYALFLGVAVFRTLTPSAVYSALKTSITSSIVILLIISAASAFGWVLAANRVPDMVASAFIAASDNKIVFLILINLLLLLVGMFLETGAAIIILAPILTPVASQFGVDPVQFGIIMIVNLAVGMTTPPVGVNLFIACQVAGVRIEQILRDMLPFYLVLIFNILLVTYIPQLSLWLPNLLH